MTLHHWIWPPYLVRPAKSWIWLSQESSDGQSFSRHISTRIQIRETAQNADALSRFPRPVSTSNDCVPADVVAVVDHLSSLAVNAQAIREWTAKDPSPPASEDLLSLVGQLTSSLPSTNPMLQGRTQCSWWLPVVGFPCHGPSPGSAAIAGRARNSSGCKQDESSCPFLYLVAWNGRRDWQPSQVLPDVPAIPPCPGSCPPSLLESGLPSGGADCTFSWATCFCVLLVPILNGSMFVWCNPYLLPIQSKNYAWCWLVSHGK